MKKFLGVLFAALLATGVQAAELTTSGLLGASGESGLVDGAVVTDQTVTFKPTAPGGAILIQGFDNTTNAELFSHMLPIKSLQLNAANPIFQLKSFAGTSAAVTDKRIVVYSGGRTLRTEFMLIGKVSGVFGGATFDGLGDGTYVWTATTSSNMGSVDGGGILTLARTAADTPGATSVGWQMGHQYGGGWKTNYHLLENLTTLSSSHIDEALCASPSCGNPLASTTCSVYAAANSLACLSVCNCALNDGGSNTWGNCGATSCNG